MKSEANVEDLRNKVVSDGTMRPEDLIPKFLGVLKEYAPDRYGAYVKENPEVLDLKGMDDETLGFVVEELFDELDKIAPEGCVFGASDGDGACYGFWDPEASESRKCERKWLGSIPVYKTATYTDVDEALDFVKDLCRDLDVTVAKTSEDSMGNMSVEVSGDDAALDLFSKLYTDNYKDIKSTCDVDVMGWTDPVDLQYYTEEGSARLKKSLYGSESRKCSERSNDDYLQEVYDELVAVWDKDKFDMAKGYDDYYECNSIKITPKDAEGFVATIYVDDFEGRHPTGFDVVYHYPGDKGVGVMGSYEFQSTNLDEVAPEIFEYFDDLKERAAAKAQRSESKKNEEKILFKDTEIPNELKQVYNACKKRFYCEPNLVSMVDSSDNGYYKMDGSFGSDVKIRIEVERKDGKFIVSVDGLDETTGYHWETLGSGESENIKQAIDTAMAGVDKNLMPFATKIHKAIKGESKKNEAASLDGSMSNAEFMSKIVEYAPNSFVFNKNNDSSKNTYTVSANPDFGKSSRHALIGLNADDDKYEVYTYLYNDDAMTNPRAGKSFVFKVGSDWNTFITTVKELFGFVGDYIKSGSQKEAKKSEGLPPKRLGSKRQYRSRADLINKMKQLGAVEITTSKQFNDIHKEQWLHNAGYALDTNGNLVAQSYYGDKDGKWYYATTKTFQGDYLPECKEAKKSESKKNEEFETIADREIQVRKPGQSWARWTVTWPEYVEMHKQDAKDKGWPEIRVRKLALNGRDAEVIEGPDESKKSESKHGLIMATMNNGKRKASVAKESEIASVEKEYKAASHKFAEVLPVVYFDDYNAANIAAQDWVRKGVKPAESKKSESLTLKQKELKDMVRYGEAEDITTLPEPEAKELYKKGLETVGLSRGTYGLNGALLRDSDGKKYAITARSSNLFYFI